MHVAATTRARKPSCLSTFGVGAGARALLMLLLSLGSFSSIIISRVNAFRPAAVTTLYGTPTCRSSFSTRCSSRNNFMVDRAVGARSCFLQQRVFHKWGLPSSRWNAPLGSAVVEGSPTATTTTRLYSSTPTRSSDDNNNDSDDGWTVPSTIHIPEESLDLSYVRSSGSGGQNVNKVNSQVQLKVLIDGMGWVPYEVRERLRQQQSNRINKEGFLVLQVQEHRMQMQNRKTAVNKLREMILQAWPRPKKRNLRKGISPKTKKQRLEDKRKRSLVKERRRPVDF